MSAAPASPESSLYAALFGGSLSDLYATAREALHTVGPIELLDAAVSAWLERRGQGGTTGSNALRSACAARQIACIRPGEDGRAAAVSALGFLHFAASQTPGSRPVPAAAVLTDWTDWGEDALLFAALERRAGRGSPIDESLCRRAAEGVAADPRLRSVRGLLLAHAVGGSSPRARARVETFLDEAPPPPKTLRHPPGDEPVEAALSRACRLDPRPTLGHALQLAATAADLLVSAPSLAGSVGNAVRASAATWPRLERHWRAFLRSSSA